MKLPASRHPIRRARCLAARVMLFLLPFALAAFVLMHRPVSRSFAWHFVRNDTEGRSVWIRDRIHASPVPVDVAFLGTSRTHVGVSGERIELLLESGGRPWHVANFGYPRSGRNFQYVIARDLTSIRRLRHLVLEVVNDEPGASHPLFGYVASTDDLLSAPFVPDPSFVRDLYRGLRVRLGQLRLDAFGLPDPPLQPDVALHAELRWHVDAHAEAGVLAAAKARGGAISRRDADPRAQTTRPEHYLRLIADLAAASGARVHFLYLPSYGWAWDELACRELYEELGDVWTPPEAIFGDSTNWMDPFHLNRGGAERLSDWIATRLLAQD